MHGGGRFIESIHRSPFRSIRATWPFIVIYTIINDTDYRRERQKERERKIYAVSRETAVSRRLHPSLCSRWTGNRVRTKRWSTKIFFTSGLKLLWLKKKNWLDLFSAAINDSLFVLWIYETDSLLRNEVSLRDFFWFVLWQKSSNNRGISKSETNVNKWDC